MYFLKCSNCGHFNEVKTEYLTFCKSCNKVLKNNYSDWIKVSPGKSFDDFKQLICTTEATETIKSGSKSHRAKGLKYWIGFTIALAIFYAIGQFGGEKISGFFKKPAFDKAMVDIANEINKTCPIMVDNATRLDNSIALPNNVFQYNYTLVMMVKDSINLNDLRNYLEPRILNDVKTNPGMKFIRDNKVTVNYSYKDMTGVNLFTISVSPEQYQ
jgi:hypothetical protein